jgi:hypothetical protein
MDWIVTFVVSHNPIKKDGIVRGYDEKNRTRIAMHSITSLIDLAPSDAIVAMRGHFKHPRGVTLFIVTFTLYLNKWINLCFGGSYLLSAWLRNFGASLLRLSIRISTFRDDFRNLGSKYSTRTVTKSNLTSQKRFENRVNMSIRFDVVVSLDVRSRF